MKKRKADLGYKGGLEGWGNPVIQYIQGCHVGLFKSLCLNTFSMLKEREKNCCKLLQVYGTLPGGMDATGMRGPESLLRGKGAGSTFDLGAWWGKWSG